MLWAFKLQGCADCGKRYPEIALADLHCHHRDPSTKRRPTSRSLTKRIDGLLGHNSHQELLDELLKCDVVCAECHKKRGRNGSRAIQQQTVLFTGTGQAWRIGDV